MEHTSEPELEEIAADECERLLALHDVGRLGVSAGGYPLIFPVNYALDRGVIVVRTHAGTKLSAADHANVCFEVDDIDRHTRAGWSVLVRGLAEEATDDHTAELVERTRAAGASPWAPGLHDRWLRVIPQAVSGRRIVPGRLFPPFELGAYL